MNSITRFASPCWEVIASAPWRARCWLIDFNRSIFGSRAAIFSRLLALVTVVGLVGQSASADSITFAQFQQAASGQPFVFTNSATSSTFDTQNPSHGLSVPVDFQFKVGNGYGPAGTNIPAQLTVTSGVDGNSLVVAGLAIQPLETIDLVFTADAPVAGHSMLLEVTAALNGSTGVLYGSSGGQTGFLSADTDPAIGNAFTFKSDFMNFAGAVTENYALSFSSILLNFSAANNHYLKSFTAAGTGTFAASLVPEPASIALFGLGAIGLFVAARRRPKA